MSYPLAKAEAIGKARGIRKSVYEIADLAALKFNLTEKQRLRLRDEVAACFIRGNIADFSK